MRTIFSLSGIAAAALLAACATTQTPPPELVAARSVVRSAESSSEVLTHAPVELKRATDSLRRADELHAKGENLGDVSSMAYVARQQAETAMAIGRAKGNEEGIKTAEVDRERARADARAAEARRAQAQAAAARADASSARADASTARSEAFSARVEASSAQQQADVARVQAGDAEARAQAARQQAAAAQASAASAALQAASLHQMLIELQARQTDRGMLVTLGDVLFEFGRADIKPGKQDALRKLATYLQDHPDRRILIEGYTDSVGSDAANMLLSQRRADAVSFALVAMGVAPGRISTRGYGESYPIADNGTDTNRALNRRVEVYISENDQPVRSRG